MRVRGRTRNTRTGRPRRGALASRRRSRARAPLRAIALLRRGESTRGTPRRESCVRAVSRWSERRVDWGSRWARASLTRGNQDDASSALAPDTIRPDALSALSAKSSRIAFRMRFSLRQTNDRDPRNDGSSVRWHKRRKITRQRKPSVGFFSERVPCVPCFYVRTYYARRPILNALLVVPSSRRASPLHRCPLTPRRVCSPPVSTRAAGSPWPRRR